MEPIKSSNARMIESLHLRRTPDGVEIVGDPPKMIGIAASLLRDHGGAYIEQRGNLVIIKADNMTVSYKLGSFEPGGYYLARLVS